MNPFTPGFGTSPRILAGRQDVLAEIAPAFGESFDAHRTTWLRAPRGCGKTVLLNEIQDLAGAAGWLVVQEDAQSSGSWVDRIVSKLSAAAQPHKRRKLRSAGVSTPVGGASFELTDPASSPSTSTSLRIALESLLGSPNAPAGVLITVDEIHTADRAMVADFGNAVQHLIRQDRPVATVVAGLPPVLGDRLATFLGRCMKPQLVELPDAVVRLCLQQTAASEGGGFSPAALDMATAVSGGYPYMMQLVGYWSWKHTSKQPISVSTVRSVLGRCEHELVETLAELANLRVSPAEDAYLAAMAEDDGPSSTSDVARRLGISATHAGVFRSRLKNAGVIAVPRRGFVDFVVPGHRARLRLIDARGHRQGP